MKIDIESYRSNFQFIKTLIENNPNEELDIVLTRAAVGTHCPLIAVYSFAIEILGETEYLLARKERIRKFYGYEA